MDLIEDWKRKFPKLWSVRLALLAAVLSTVEVILPMFQEFIPRGPFAIVAAVVAIGAAVARVVAQPSLHDDQQPAAK
jgi:uncharacterized membrane protein